MEVSGQLHALSAFPTWESAHGNRWIGSLAANRAGLDAVEEKKKSSALAGNQTPIVQPVAIPTAISRLLPVNKASKNNKFIIIQDYISISAHRFH
jgi:soluble lytic murein transglycosylase-like protein